MKKYLNDSSKYSANNNPFDSHSLGRQDGRSVLTVLAILIREKARGEIRLRLGQAKCICAVVLQLCAQRRVIQGKSVYAPIYRWVKRLEDIPIS
jgi:hypothetical protein